MDKPTTIVVSISINEDSKEIKAFYPKDNLSMSMVMATLLIDSIKRDMLSELIKDKVNILKP